MHDATVECPSCRQTNPAGMKFCGQCGTPFAPAHPVAPVQVYEDRRLVTVLFCDLVGFTPLSEKLDAEEVREIQDAYFLCMSGEIKRYGGTVEKYAGDAVLAIFGAPIVHEDDAERAVRCALRMHVALLPLADETRRTRGVDLALRVGVNTGEVVSGLRHGGGRHDYAVTGDAVNTAARFQAAATPGGVMVGEETMRLAGRRVFFGARMELTLKGKSSPVPAYTVLGLRERPVERWEMLGKAALFLGRGHEIEIIQEAWKATSRGEGQVVVVRGEAGVGKSRLLDEVIGALPGEKAIVRGHCLSYGQEISLSLVAGVIRHLIGVGEEQGTEATLAGLVRTVGSLLTDEDEETGDVARDVLGELLGMPPGNSILAEAGAEMRREALVHTLQLIFQRWSARTAGVLVLEDLHWIDSASREVVSAILRVVRDQRVLAVVTMRPEAPLPWQSWQNVRQIDLQPLSERDAQSLVEMILGVTPSPELRLQLASRAGGNPFFVEELLRALHEAGDLEERRGVMHLAKGAEDRVPSTLTEVILARLDRLEHSVRTLAQVGSVIGRRFACSVLAATMGQQEQALEPQLGALERAALAFRQWNSELEYLFKHAVVRDVAYSTLLLKRRREIHAAVARALLELYAADEVVEVVAYHFAQTEELAEAAVWLERAGDRAAAMYNNEVAVARYEEASSRRLQVEADPPAQARIDEKLGGVLTLQAQYDAALHVLGRAAAAFRSHDDQEGLGRVTAAIGRVHVARGTPADGLPLVEQFLRAQEDSTQLHCLSFVYVALSSLFNRMSRYEDALRAAEHAQAQGRATHDSKVQIDAGIEMAGALASLGRYQDGLQVMENVVPLAERAGDPQVVLRTVLALGGAYEEIGNVRRCLIHFERALELARRLQGPAWIVGALGSCARIQYRLAEWDQMWDLTLEALQICRRMEATSALPIILYHLGAACVFRGRWDEADRYLDEALQLAGQMQAMSIIRWANGFAAQGDILRGNPERGRDRLLALLDREGLEEPDVTWFLPVLAWAHLEAGDSDQARATARQAIRRGKGYGDKIVLSDALWVSGRIASYEERWEDAEQFLMEGLALTRGNSFRWAELRTTFEYGCMQAGAGKMTLARTTLEGVCGEFRRLQAQPYVERTERELARFR